MKAKYSVLSALMVVAMLAVAASAFFKLQPQGASGTQTAAAPNAAIADIKAAPEAPVEPLPEGAIEVGVEKLWSDPAAYEGLVALEGYVTQSFPDRGAFVMADLKEAECCPEAGCAEFTVPAKVPATEFSGEVPNAMESVVAIGKVTPRDKGFDFSVSEVRRDGKVILKRISDAA